MFPWYPISYQVSEGWSKASDGLRDGLYLITSKDESSERKIEKAIWEMRDLIETGTET